VNIVVEFVFVEAVAAVVTAVEKFFVVAVVKIVVVVAFVEIFAVVEEFELVIFVVEILSSVFKIYYFVVLQLVDFK
jgi:hypothetical protein